MARNTVQFQKGLSEPAFERHYGTEEQCRAVVMGFAVAERLRVSRLRWNAAQRGEEP